MIKRLNKNFFAAILTFAMAIGMIAPVNVAANDEYLNFDQDSIYAIVSTTTGKALNIKTASWTSPAEADGEYNAKTNKISNSSQFMFINENDGSVTIKYTGINDGQDYYLRTESGQTYVWADTRNEDTTAKYKITKTADNQGIIESMKRTNEYLSIDSKGKLVYTSDRDLAEKFNFVKNPGIISNIAWIENVATGKLVTFADQPDENFSAIKVTGDAGNIGDTEKFKITFHTNDNGIKNVISFESVSKPGYQIASAKWVDGAVPTIGSYKKVGGGWEAIAVEPIGNGLFVLKDAATGKLVTANNDEVLEGGYEGELTDREKFIIHNAIDIADVTDLKADDSSRTETTIDLTWTNPNSLYTDVTLFKKASNEVVFDKVADVTGKNSYQVTDLKAGMQYSFKLEYVNGNGNLSDINNPKNESAELKVSTRAGAKPATPADVKLVEKDGEFTISWGAAENATHYQLLRADSMLGEYNVVETVTRDSTSVTVAPIGDKYENYYRIIALNNGQNNDDDLSNAEISERSEYVSLEKNIFGEHTLFFSPKDDVAQLDKILLDLFNQQNDRGADAQFKGQQYQVYFKPGDYTETTCMYLGFYTSFNGLGKIPMDVKLNNIAIPSYLDGNNATCNFWRSAENLAVINTGNEQGKAGFDCNLARPEYFNWAVAQAAPLRRVYSSRPVGYDWNYGWASGGYVADCMFEGVFEDKGNQLSAGTYSGQQFYTRNSKLTGGGYGTTLNNFFQGVDAPNLPTEKDGDALANGNGYSNWGKEAANGEQQVFTNVEKTKKLSEKPFLYLDNGEYKIFVPNLQKDTSGTSWTKDGDMGKGKSLSLSEFYIAKPSDSAKTINEQLDKGKNIYFTPGTYHAEESIKVNKANTILIGTGMTSIIPDNDEAAMEIADVDGIKVAGLIFDAGEKDSNYLLKVGPANSDKNHSANPTILQDLFFRVGGTTANPTRAKNALEINSNDVITDHFWIWRADHGNGVSWSGNAADHGLIVNGDNVTCYALFNEHFNKYDTLWNGENGATYFYQNEKCYDPISQEAWMSHNGTVNGYAAYKVANDVKEHYAVGLGIYNVFIYTGEDYDSSKVRIQMDSAIEVPNSKGVIIENACLQTFADENKVLQKFNHIINDVGPGVSSGTDKDDFAIKGEGWSRKFLLNYCDGTAVYGKMPAADQKGKFIGTVTEENIKALGDDNIDTKTLSDLYNVNKDKNENNYTVDSWKVFVKALDDAGKQLNADLKYAYQKDFDSAKDVLNDAIDNLVLVGADYSKVDSIKAEAEKVLASDNYTKDYYTEATRATFDKANKALNDLADDLTILEQNKVDDAIELLTEAINGLTLKGADYSKLDVVKKEAEKVLISDNYTKGHYTEESKALFDEAYEVLSSLADNLTIIDQGMVDEVVKALDTAIKGLTLKTEEPGQIVKPNEPGQSTKPSDSSSAKTGDDQMIYGYGIVTLLALGGLMMLKRHHTS